jgi:hypothetical protein
LSRASAKSGTLIEYQTLVAFEWTLAVLSDPDYSWIEVDLVASPVDDVVIGREDGKTICCQCEKNQTYFDAWTIADLGEELSKAPDFLVSDIVKPVLVPNSISTPLSLAFGNRCVLYRVLLFSCTIRIRGISYIAYFISFDEEES